VVAVLGLQTAYPILLANMLVGGIGVLGGQIGLNALAGTIYPTYMRATGAGWGLGIGRIGTMAGPLVGGILLSMQLARPTLLFLTAIPLFFCGIALFGLQSAKRAQDSRAGVNGLATADFAH
jgi:AAHS family 4-hydroxybenzoate transporter-like MFS transporter